MVIPVRPENKNQRFEHEVYHYLDNTLDPKKWTIKYKPGTPEGIPDIKLFYKVDSFCGWHERCKKEGGCHFENPVIVIEISNWSLSGDPVKSTKSLEAEIRQVKKYEGQLKVLITPQGFEKGEAVSSDDKDVFLMKKETIIEVCRMFEDLWDFEQEHGTAYETCGKSLRIKNKELSKWFFEALQPCKKCGHVAKPIILERNKYVKVCKNCKNVEGEKEVISRIIFVEKENNRCPKCNSYLDEELEIFECNCCTLSSNPCYGVGTYGDTDKGTVFEIEGFCTNWGLSKFDRIWKETRYNAMCNSCDTPCMLIY